MWGGRGEGDTSPQRKWHHPVPFDLLNPSFSRQESWIQSGAAVVHLLSWAA